MRLGSIRLRTFNFTTSSLHSKSKQFQPQLRSISQSHLSAIIINPISNSRSYSHSHSHSHPHPCTRFYSTSSIQDSSSMPTGTLNPPSNSFPVDGLLPKESTQSLSFRRKYPTYDGRNVRIAILDTGVDPAAAGLNSHGKVVDVIDCTGSGDIILSDIPKDSISKQGQDGNTSIKAPFTGRTILLSSDLKNPSGNFKYGYVKAYDLWPKDLIARRKKERFQSWKVEHEKLVSITQEELIKLGVSPKEIEKVKDSNDEEKKEDGSTTTTIPSSETTDSTITTPHAQKVAELKTRISVLKDLVSSYNDLGPIIELIAFNDGENWRALIGGGEGDFRDSSLGLNPNQLSPLSSKESSLDLTKIKPITDFKINGEHDFFGQMDLLTFSVNFLSNNQDLKIENPDRISLVVVAGSHGSHVAGITSANFDSDSNGNLSDSKNGVSPGSKIISLKIGDSRLGSMEQGQALLRAAQALITTKTDIANLSYGEDGAFGVENKGAFAESLRDHVIRKRDILFISSAGNNGPALSTTGQPGGSTDGVLSVGAYVTSGSMQKAEYALVEDCKDSPTTWCSRGPCADGEKGVGIYAPGAAITSIPKYCLQTSQLMNGTSMSSPNACGAIALLLSAMKQEKIPITAARVIKAVKATGKDVNDDLGVGFLQVDAAWDYIVANKDRPDSDAEFRVAVTPAGKPLGHSQTDKRGIYLRELLETQRINQYNVTVKPTFHSGETEKAYELQLQCAITTSASWVKAPEFLLLGSNGRTFEVRVDSTSLEAGKLHTASIEIYDSETPGFKLFEIPITVAKPSLSPSKGTIRYSNLQFSNGKVDRKFLHIPEGAQWAEARIRSSNHSSIGTASKLWIHLVQIEPHQRLHEVEKAYVLNLIEDEPVLKKFSVKGGMTMEVCLAQFWAQNSGFDLDIEFEFHGIQASRIVTGRDDLTIIGGEGYARIECVSLLRPEEFKPTISFETRRTYSRPVESSISPLNSPRDIQPSGKQLFELITTYNLKLNESNNSIQYSLPLSNNLYDSAVPMLCQLFDSRKKRIDFGDVYPKNIDLPRGEYILKVQMLHENMEVLTKLKNSTLRLDQKLSKPKDVKLDLYEDHVDLFGETKPSNFSKGSIKLFPGERKILCLDTNLEGEAVPKEAQPGDVLIGTFSFAPEGKNQLRYVVPPSIKKEKEPSSTPTNQKESTLELMISLVKKISDEEEKKKFLKKLLDENPKDLGVLISQLENLKVEKDSDEILATVKEILALCDEEEIFNFIGVKKLPVSEQSNEFKIKNQLIEKKKSAVILALNRKCRCLLIRNDGKTSTEFEETFSRYRKYFAESSNDKDFVNVYVQWNMLRSQYGTALQSVRKLLKDLGNGNSENLEEHKKARTLELELLQHLKWNLWSSYAERKIVLDEPKDYAPF